MSYRGRVRMFVCWCWGLGFFQAAAVAHQVEYVASEASVASSKGTMSSYLRDLESGRIDSKSLPEPLVHLAQGDYQRALDSFPIDAGMPDLWIKSYLNDLVHVSSGMVEAESEHFIFRTSPEQLFLSDYALPALEKMAARLSDILRHQPAGKIIVEVYPDKSAFSRASTLSEETLERSGAIGICKFHRLMIVSPRALPLGYRWLDTLAHEYTHLVINELSQTQTELWLHEGIARYFDTFYRADPPIYLTPTGKTKLIEARDNGTLVPFSRMSPSMVYLKNQDEVSLAFAQVAHAVSVLVNERGGREVGGFLSAAGQVGSRLAFQKVFGFNQEEFENHWLRRLNEEKWEKVRGAMGDEVHFHQREELSFVGADAQNVIRLGDRMRQKGLLEAAMIQYQRALESEPDNAIILLKLAKVNILRENTAEAVSNLKRAIEKNPNYGTPYITLAPLVSPKDAVLLWLEANAINPFDPRIHQGLGTAYRLLGEGGLAERELQIWQLLSAPR